MKERVGALMTEMVFVLVSVAVLKEWLFPFFIRNWFADADLVSAQLELTAVLAGAITALIYTGLGSAAKHVHGLTYAQSLGAFAAVHAPVLVGRIPAGDPLSLFRSVHLTWEGLLGDALAPFRVVEPEFLSNAVLLLTLLLYTMGRGIRVEDGQEREKPAEQRVRIRSFRS